jgi:hypothetical protein
MASKDKNIHKKKNRIPITFQSKNADDPAAAAI